jgi:hypothetical protein
MSRGFIIAIIIVCGSCNTQKKTTAVQDNCKGLPKLRWQTEKVSNTDSSFIDFVAGLSAAAKFDASVSQRVYDSIGLKLQSQLAKKVSVVANSSVSQEFWEADIVFRQTLCFLDNKLSGNDLSENLRKAIESEYISIIESRRIYLNELQKKTSVK